MKKLKGCSKAIKMKYLIFVFVAAMLAALPTRVYQLLALVNVETGFYDNGDITVPVLYGVVAVFSLLFLVLSYLSKEVPSPKLPTGKNPVLGVASIVGAIGFLWDILVNLRALVPGYDSENTSFLSLLAANFEQNGSWVLILRLVCAFLSIFWFLIFAISHLNGKASYKEYKLLALAPVCWGVAALMGKLTSAVSFFTVSELLFEIFVYVFATVFFLTFARISTGVFTEDSMWSIYGCGFSAALFAGLVTIPRLICMMVSLPAVEGHDFSFTDLGIFVFAISYILASLGIGFKDGFKNIRTVDAIELPDDEDIVIKRRDNEVVGELASFEDFSEDSFDEYGEDAFESLAEEQEYELVDTADEPIAQAPVIEEPVIEEPVIEEPVIEEPVIEEPVIEEPVIEEPVIEEPVIEEPVIEEPVIEEPVIEEPVIEKPVIEEPVVDENAINAEVASFFEKIEKFEEPAEETEKTQEADEKAEAFEEIFKESAEVGNDEIPADLIIDDTVDGFNDIAEESDGVLEMPEEIAEEALSEEEPADDIVVAETPKKEKKSKKEKSSLFSRKKTAPEVDDIPEDLKPISWADLKNKE